MKNETYEILFIETAKRYYFVSEGRRLIVKVVTFEPIEANKYNLALGDADLDSDSIDHKAKSRNGDTEKVFATVGEIIENFLVHNPGSIVYIAGDEEYKTKSYLMALNRFYNELILKYEFKGLEMDWINLKFIEVDYKKNEKYIGFAIAAKKFEV